MERSFPLIAPQRPRVYRAYHRNKSWSTPEIERTLYTTGCSQLQLKIVHGLSSTTLPSLFVWASSLAEQEPGTVPTNRIQMHIFPGFYLERLHHSFRADRGTNTSTRSHWSFGYTHKNWSLYSFTEDAIILLFLDINQPQNPISLKLPWMQQVPPKPIHRKSRRHIRNDPNLHTRPIRTYLRPHTGSVAVGLHGAGKETFFPPWTSHTMQQINMSGV